MTASSARDMLWSQISLQKDFIRQDQTHSGSKLQKMSDLCIVYQFMLHVLNLIIVS